MVNCIHEIARGNFYFQVSIVLNYSLNLDFKDKNISSPIEITDRNSKRNSQRILRSNCQFCVVTEWWKSSDCSSKILASVH